LKARRQAAAAGADEGLLPAASAFSASASAMP